MPQQEESFFQRGLRGLGFQLPQRINPNERVPLPNTPLSETNPWIDKVIRVGRGLLGLTDERGLYGSDPNVDNWQAIPEAISGLSPLAGGLKGLGAGAGAVAGALGRVDLPQLRDLIHIAKKKLPDNIRSLGQRWWSVDADRLAREDYIQSMLDKPEYIQDVRDTLRPAFEDTEFPVLRGISSRGQTASGTLPGGDIPTRAAARGFTPDANIAEGFHGGNLWTGEASLDDIIAIGNSRETELMMDPRSLKGLKFTPGYTFGETQINKIRNFYVNKLKGLKSLEELPIPDLSPEHLRSQYSILHAATSKSPQDLNIDSDMWGGYKSKSIIDNPNPMKPKGYYNMSNGPLTNTQNPAIDLSEADISSSDELDSLFAEFVETGTDKIFKNIELKDKLYSHYNPEFKSYLDMNTSNFKGIKNLSSKDITKIIHKDMDGLPLTPEELEIMDLHVQFQKEFPKELPDDDLTKGIPDGEDYYPMLDLYNKDYYKAFNNYYKAQKAWKAAEIKNAGPK